MNFLKRAALVAALALPLGACASMGEVKTMTPAEKLAAACAVEAAAWDDFVAYTQIKPVKQSLYVTLEAADRQAKAYCANPPSNPTAALIQVTNAGVQIGLAYLASK